MASPKTIERKRNQSLAILTSMKAVGQKGPNRDERRRKLKKLSKLIGVPYHVSRETIREVEAKMRMYGIDPREPGAFEKLQKWEKGMSNV